MPKQIVNKKETPVMIKATTSDYSNGMNNLKSAQNRNESVSVVNNSNNITNKYKSNQNNINSNMTGAFGNKNGIEKDKEQAVLINDSFKEMQVPYTRNSKKMVTIDDKER